MSEAVRRVVAILEAMADHDDDVGVRQVAEAVAASKSSVHRLLAAMVEGGLAERDAATERYRLGPLCLRLGAAYENRIDLRRLARQPMADLRDRSGETVGLSVLVAGEVFHIAQAQSRNELRRTFAIGRAHPPWAGAPSRALLAGLSHEGVEELVRAGRPAQVVPSAPPCAEEMIAAVARTRERGWAVARDETVPGVTSLAAPVRGALGRVVAALTITGPTHRLVGGRVEELVPDLLLAAGQIAGALGYREVESSTELT